MRGMTAGPTTILLDATYETNRSAAGAPIHPPQPLILVENVQPSLFSLPPPPLRSAT